MLPGRPVRHEVGVGDQHARRIGMRAENADRLAGLHEQRLVAFEPPQRRDDAVEAFPVARGAPDAAIDDELARPLRHLRVEVVHQHAERRFGQPGLGGELRAARRADGAGVVDAGHDDVILAASKGIDGSSTPSGRKWRRFRVRSVKSLRDRCRCNDDVRQVLDARPLRDAHLRSMRPRDHRRSTGRMQHPLAIALDESREPVRQAPICRAIPSDFHASAQNAALDLHDRHQPKEEDCCSLLLEPCRPPRHRLRPSLLRPGANVETTFVSSEIPCQNLTSRRGDRLRARMGYPLASISSYSMRFGFFSGLIAGRRSSNRHDLRCRAAILGDNRRLARSPPPRQARRSFALASRNCMVFISDPPVTTCSHIACMRRRLQPAARRENDRQALKIAPSVTLHLASPSPRHKAAASSSRRPSGSARSGRTGRRAPSGCAWTPSAGRPWLRVIQPPLKRRIRRPGKSRRVADRLDDMREAGVAARAGIRADVHVRQLALEEPRDHRADRMAVEEARCADAFP